MLAVMNYSKAQMVSVDDSSARCPQSSPAGVKLEAMMGQLQRQQEAKLEMNLQGKQLLQAQLLFAQQAAAAAAARASGSRPDPLVFASAEEKTYQKVKEAFADRVRRTDPQQDEDSDEDDHEMLDPEENNGEDGEEPGSDPQARKPAGRQQAARLPFQPYSTSPPAAPEQTSQSPPANVKQELEEKNLMSPAGPHAFISSNGFPDWGYDEPFKQVSRSALFQQQFMLQPHGSNLYELDSDPQRKEFLDELFVFMQKRGTPVNRIPIMAKQVLDLYKLYKLVTEKGGLVEVINKKIWREITKGLNLPTSITSAAFTLRTQYMKYLYPFECDKKGLSSPGELQAAIDSNRREGRRPSYTSSLYRYSSSPSSAPHPLLSSPTMQTKPATPNGLNTAASPNLKRNTDEPSTPVIPRLPMALALGQQQQQQQQLAQAATLEHLRERLERGAAGAAAGSPEKKMMRLAEEQQRLMQQALQQNLLAMASQLNPGSLKLNNGQETKHDLSLNISTNGPSSINVSVEVNGTVYSGTLFAQKSAAPVSSQMVTPAGTSGFSALSSSHSPSSSSSTSSKGPN
uniref:AT-rich interactive domain-containing protein 3 n=1 Tax=Salarias fasciatus TaxID=181472 RepID=A0A672IRW8_SALFA